MKILFISDLHLSAKRPELSALFFHFLETYAKTADTLYILGDFFETWVGIDVLDQHEIQILAALKKYTDLGKSVYFMHGNRDFLINKEFEVKSGCKLISDPYVLPFNVLPLGSQHDGHQKADNRWVLCHGDALCTLDLSYQRYRKFVRHPWVQTFFLSLPEFIRRKIANSLRNKSKAHQHKFVAYPEKWDVTKEAVEQVLKSHQANILLHGHTHKPKIYDFIMDNKPCKRIVLGDWGKTGNFLALENGEFQFKIFNLDS
jgi:UDP-2,3-diacylglucosamine hydrolase